MTEKPDSV